MHRLKSSSVTKLAQAVVCLALALLTPQAALAGKAHLYGSNAWTNVPGALYGGPGVAYGQVGAVDGEIRLLVDRCTGQWCQVRAGRQAGWFPLDHLDFGVAPGGPFSGPKLNYPSGGPGLVCFYSGANFSGQQFCAPPGTYVRDLKLFGRDNGVGSIQIIGNSSATVCRDFNLTSYCSRIVLSKPHLPDELRNAVSSFKVH